MCVIDAIIRADNPWFRSLIDKRLLEIFGETFMKNKDDNARRFLIQMFNSWKPYYVGTSYLKPISDRCKLPYFEKTLLVESFPEEMTDYQNFINERMTPGPSNESQKISYYDQVRPMKLTSKPAVYTTPQIFNSQGFPEQNMSHAVKSEHSNHFSLKSGYKAAATSFMSQQPHNKFVTSNNCYSNSYLGAVKPAPKGRLNNGFHSRPPKHESVRAGKPGKWNCASLTDQLNSLAPTIQKTVNLGSLKPGYFDPPQSIGGLAGPPPP